MKITSDTPILQKSNGINSDSAQWLAEGDTVKGNYKKIDAPENWAEIIAEADENTYGAQSGQTEIGKGSDWEWYQLTEQDENGYSTGIEWLVARYIG